MIVAIGEALIDIKENGSFVGGCPLNVCLAAARQGAGISFLGGISSDEYGQRILSYIIDNCILFDPVFCSSEKRTMTSKVRIEDGKEQYDFDMEDTSAFEISTKQLEEVFAVNTDINCAFFGSVAFTDAGVRNEIVSFLETKLEVIRFFDPNIRTFAVSDMSSYVKALDECASFCQIVKVSDDDLRLWGKTEEELFKLCREHLIVTRGENGAAWYSKSLGKCISVDAVKAEHLVDTIGCGDVFSGSVLAYLDRNGKLTDFNLTENDIKTCLELAVKAASLNCTKSGCNPPYPDELNV